MGVDFRRDLEGSEVAERFWKNGCLHVEMIQPPTISTTAVLTWIPTAGFRF